MTRTWTRTVAALLVAAATAALLAVGAGTAAASSTLSFSKARHLAERLARQQREKRSLRFTELGHAHRVSSSRIDFRYADRSTDNVLCRATIVVVQTSDSRHADLTDVACHGIPSEVLSYERVTRHMRSDVKDRAGDVSRSVHDYDSSLGRCDGIVVPKKRRSQVDLLFKLGGTRAFYTPLRPALDRFNTALHDVHGEDPRTTRGVDAWDRTLVLLDELPDVTADPCPAVKKWAKHGFSSDSAPADFGRLGVIRKQFGVQEQVLDEVAHHLRDSGVYPKIAAAFTPANFYDGIRP